MATAPSMDPGEKMGGRAAPISGSLADVYASRLLELNLRQSADQRSERRLAFAKLALLAVTIAGALVFLYLLKIFAFIAVPAALFVVLAVLHDNLIRRLRRRARAIVFYERGQARLEDRWAATGETGDHFLDPLHPYARDLDLFGAGSMFELLCTARTRAGEETLAAWLLAAAPVDTVLARQEAVRDLMNRVALREQLFCLGETVRLSVHPEALSAWGERKPVFAARITRIVTRSLTALWVLSLIGWAISGLGAIAVAVSILNFAWAHRIRRQEEAAELIERAADGLQLLSGVLALFEHERFCSPKMLALQAALMRDGTAPSSAIRTLARLAEAVAQRHNRFLKAPDAVIFFSAQLLFAAERWQQQFGPAIRRVAQSARRTRSIDCAGGLCG